MFNLRDGHRTGISLKEIEYYQRIVYSGGVRCIQFGFRSGRELTVNYGEDITGLTEDLKDLKEAFKGSKNQRNNKEK